MNKKLLFSLAFVLALVVNTSAQYASTLTEGNAWLGRVYGWGVTDYQYVIDGDSTVMNTIYKKLYATHGEATEATLMALLWEDLSEGKIYRYHEEGDQLLFDYSLDAGESATIYALGSQFEVTIQSVETITVDGTPRKKLYFTDAGRPAFWIEGIGSNYGINDPALGFSADYDPIVYCFYAHNDLVWTAATDDFQCEMVLSVHNYKAEYPIEVWPNPFTDNISFALLGYVANGTATITSSTGKLVKQQSIPSFRSPRWLNLSDLESGIYLLTITTNEGATQTKRIVKI